jgi:hypothetical protein
LRGILKSQASAVDTANWRFYQNRSLSDIHLRFPDMHSRSRSSRIASSDSLRTPTEDAARFSRQILLLHSSRSGDRIIRLPAVNQREHAGFFSPSFEGGNKSGAAIGEYYSFIGHAAQA